MGSRIDHIGIVVDDLNAGVAFLRRGFGLEVDRFADEPAAGVKAAFLGFGSLSIELIEPTSPSAKRARLDGATADIDHIAIAVDDLDASLERLAEVGVASVPPGAVEMVGRRLARLDASTTAGVRYQLVEAAKRGSQETEPEASAAAPRTSSPRSP